MDDGDDVEPDPGIGSKQFAQKKKITKMTEQKEIYERLSLNQLEAESQDSEKDALGGHE